MTAAIPAGLLITAEGEVIPTSYPILGNVVRHAMPDGTVRFFKMARAYRRLDLNGESGYGVAIEIPEVVYENRVRA